MTPKISFVISCYNNGQHIRDCIQSVILQNYDYQIEVIVVDDRSQDQSRRILDELKSDSRLKVIQKGSNEGLMSSRLSGFHAATGEYIHFIDGDDKLAENFSINILDELESMPDMLCFAHKAVGMGQQLFVPNNIVDGEYDRIETGDFIEKAIFVDVDGNHGIYPNVWCKLFKRKILDLFIRNVSKDIFIGEDGRITYGALNYCSTIKITSNTGYLYRQHAKSTLKSEGDSVHELSGIKILRDELSFEFRHKDPKIGVQVDRYISSLIRLRVSPFELEKVIGKHDLPEDLHTSDLIALNGCHPGIYKLRDWISHQYPGVVCLHISELARMQPSRQLLSSFRRLWLLEAGPGLTQTADIFDQTNRAEVRSLEFSKTFTPAELDLVFAHDFKL